MNLTRFTLLRFFLPGLFIIFSTVLLAVEKGKLAKIHESIEDKYEAVNHLDAGKLEQLVSDDVIIFDVREKNEFEVSHLPGALLVSPDISKREFLSKYRDLTRDKQVVFYCSVGRRSSELANEVQDGLFNSGTNAVYNLEGGIFNWHNEQRGLQSESGSTDYVHPYNSYWGRILERPEMIRYRAR